MRGVALCKMWCISIIFEDRQHACPNSWIAPHLLQER